MPDREVIQLRDYFERLLKEQETRFTLRLNALEGAWRSSVAAQNKALDLQAKEYERRLDGLNHEAARIQRFAERAVSLEKFEGFEQRFRDYVATTSKALDVREGSKRTISAMWALIPAAVSMAGVIVAIIVALTR